MAMVVVGLGQSGAGEQEKAGHEAGQGCFSPSLVRQVERCCAPHAVLFSNGQHVGRSIRNGWNHRMTTNRINDPPSGLIFYDGQCPSCRGLADRFETRLRRRGFRLVPLQADGVQERLGLSPEELLHELRVLMVDGRLLGGADALIYLAGQIWWARPFYLAARIPGMKPLLRWGYGHLAERRYCVRV